MVIYYGYISHIEHADVPRYNTRYMQALISHSNIEKNDKGLCTFANCKSMKTAYPNEA